MSVVFKYSSPLSVLNVFKKPTKMIKHASYAAVSLSLLSCASPIHAMEEQQEPGQLSAPVKVKHGKRKRDEAVELKSEPRHGQDHFVKEEKEADKEKEKGPQEPDLKKAKLEDAPEATDYFNDSPPEIQNAICLRVIDLGGHDGLISFTRSKLAQDNQFEKLKAIYAPAHSTARAVLIPFLENLNFSLPVAEIRNVYLGKPVSFYYEDFVEQRCWGNPRAQKYQPTNDDVKSLGTTLQAINTIDEITFNIEGDLKSPYFTQLEGLLEDLKICNLRKLRLRGPDVQGPGLLPYENHFLETLWPIIRAIPSLRSLEVFLEDDASINALVRNIAELDTPLEHLNFAYFNLQGTVADGIALLIAQSSSLKTLEVHDIGTNLNSLKPIIISAKRKATFEKFSIKAPNDHNDYNGEQEGIKGFINGNPKFYIWDFED